MNTVNVAVATLRKTLSDNCQEHEKEFNEAFTAYKRKAAEQLRSIADKLDEGEDADLYVRLPKPHNHAKSYRDALEMLEWHQGSTIDLDRQDFAHYVQDDWAWKGEFIATSSRYK